jgi:hypothetical protein
MIVEKSEKCGRITRNNRGERKSKTRSFSCARSLDRSLTRSIARSLARSLAHWRELYTFFLLSQEFFFLLPGMLVDRARRVTVQSRGRGELGTRSVALFVKRGGGEESVANSAVGMGVGIQPGVLQNLRLPQEALSYYCMPPSATGVSGLKRLGHQALHYWCIRP